jgi:hypothetical protein
MLTLLVAHCLAVFYDDTIPTPLHAGPAYKVAYSQFQTEWPRSVLTHDLSVMPTEVGPLESCFDCILAVHNGDIVFKSTPRSGRSFPNQYWGVVEGRFFERFLNHAANDPLMASIAAESNDEVRCGIVRQERLVVDWSLLINVGAFKQVNGTATFDLESYFCMPGRIMVHCRDGIPERAEIVVNGKRPNFRTVVRIKYHGSKEFEGRLFVKEAEWTRIGVKCHENGEVISEHPVRSERLALHEFVADVSADDLRKLAPREVPPNTYFTTDENKVEYKDSRGRVHPIATRTERRQGNYGVPVGRVVIGHALVLLCGAGLWAFWRLRRRPAKA